MISGGTPLVGLGPVSMVLAGSSHELQLQLTAQDIIHIEKLMHLNVSYSIACEADPNVESGEHSACLATLLRHVSGHIARHLLAGLTYPGSPGISCQRPLSQPSVYIYIYIYIYMYYSTRAVIGWSGIHIAMPSKTHLEHILQKYCWSWHIGIGSVSRLVCGIVVLYIATDYWLDFGAHPWDAHCVVLCTPPNLRKCHFLLCHGIKAWMRIVRFPLLLWSYRIVYSDTQHHFKIYIPGHVIEFTQQHMRGTQT